MIPRILAKTIENSWQSGFVTIISGARRVGKTVLLEQLNSQWAKGQALIINGDSQEGKTVLDTNSEVKLSNLVKDRKFIFIDEAQGIPNVGLALKIIIDKFPDKKIVVTGSVNLFGVPGFRDNLVGRQQSFLLYPFSTKELTFGTDDYKKISYLDDQLIYGGYPYVWDLATPTEKKTYLENLTADYLFKDTVFLGRIGEPDLLRKLATLLAFQVGSEASLGELANQLQIDYKTVRRYLDFLENSFVVFSLGAFSKNLRREVAGKRKWYFYDLGIRNSLTGQFLPLNQRTDVGGLWENFLLVERLKKREYAKTKIPSYFWRNYQGAEVDYLEMTDKKLFAFEFKWGKSSGRTPKAFREGYGVSAKIVNRENYLDFIL